MDLQSTLQLHRTGRLAEAETAYRSLLSAGQTDPALHARLCHLLGMVLFQTDRDGEAVVLLRRSVEHAPNVPEYHANLAAALGRLGRHGEAAEALREALRLRVDYPEARQNLGVALELSGRPEEAVEVYREAIRLRADYPEAHNHLGNALRQLGRGDEALTAYRRAVSLRPDYADAHRGLATLATERGDLPAALNAHRQVVALQPDNAAAGSDLLLTLQYDPAQTPRTLFDASRAWAARHAEPLTRAARPHAVDRDPNRRLRVGYVSPDFRDHPVGRLLEPVLCCHDREKFEVYCYSDVARPDAVTAHLRGLADVWRDIAGVPDAAADELIRRDRIDVLVDCAGHFAGNRLTLFARRPAPLQISAFGYCGTTGMTAIDCRLTDAHSDPPGETERFHTERLVRLPDCAWCYRPFEPTPDVAPPPSLAGGHVTFGCLNNLIKVSDECLGTWSDILRAVPDARLLLLARPAADAFTRARFARHGIAHDRLELVRPAPRGHYLHLYDRIDVGLDPFPFNGDNTTCDALWMGVPVVTLIGRAFADRRGLSHLSNVELAELATETVERYADAGVALANDPARRAELRETLRARLSSRPPGGAEAFVLELEGAFRSEWERRDLAATE